MSLSKSLVILLTLMILNAASASAFEMSDVSVLLPLPQASELSLLLSASASGSQGALLPESVLSNLVGITLDTDAHTTFSQRLKVIAVRIDPCFAEGAAPAACRHQIRFVWQPLLIDGKTVSAQDAALHSFYDLSDLQWQDFLSRYRELIAQNPSVPAGALNVNSQFHASSQAFENLKSLLLAFCGAGTLTRVTTMGLGSDQKLWTFSGFDISRASAPDQTMTPIVIPVVNATLQVVTSQVLETANYQMTIEPLNGGKLAFDFLADSANIAQKYSSDDIREFVGQALESENPAKTNTGTLDCASCHTQMATINWAFDHFKDWDWKSLKHDHAFQSSLPLLAPLKSSISSRLRAFGYLGAVPVIAPRTVNETANVLQALQ